MTRGGERRRGGLRGGRMERSGVEGRMERSGAESSRAGGHRAGSGGGSGPGTPRGYQEVTLGTPLCHPQASLRLGSPLQTAPQQHREGPVPWTHPPHPPTIPPPGDHRLGKLRHGAVQNPRSP